jgi:hypothetical protein
MVVTKWKAMFGGIQFVISDPLSLPPTPTQKIFT